MGMGMGVGMIANVECKKKGGWEHVGRLMIV